MVARGEMARFWSLESLHMGRCEPVNMYRSLSVARLEVDVNDLGGESFAV